jgi:hypothetical protein
MELPWQIVSLRAKKHAGQARNHLTDRNMAAMNSRNFA